MPIPARIGSWSLALLLLVVAAGCGSNSFLGQRFDNFTAFYNTFYNAEQAYEQGVQAMEGSTEPIDRTRYLPVFGGAARVGGNVSFQNAIDKGADVLRDHPNSKWVDDALLLIGKSYFYQSNYVGAEQKFREVIDLGSNLEDEARIWLARTLISSGAYGDARDHLATSLEAEDVSDRWAPRLHLALGELYVKQEALEAAAQELETGLADVRDNELEAKASFLLGQVYETLERYEDAVAAYRRVQTAHPRYELSYAANLSAVRVEGLYLDEAGALEELRRMERDGKNYNNRYEIAYVRGRIYQAQGRAQDARSLFREILWDREAQLNDLRGRLHYALAELYRDDFNDYLVASAHFDSARTALTSQAPQSRSGGAEGAPQYASEAITDAEFQAEVYGSFADVRQRIARMDSLLELGSLSQEAFQERILEIRLQLAEELAEQQRRAAQLEAERGFQDAASRTESRPTNASAAASQNTGESGFLYHRDPIRVQEARLNFTAQWGDRPLVPNWRRAEAIAGTGSAAAAGPLVGSDLEVAERAAQDTQLPPLDYSDVPRDSSSQARMESERARARYELANVLFLSMNRPDSAAVWYRMVVNEDAEEEVAQRAFYALAEVHRSLGDAEAATRLYEQVLRAYPESDFAGRVREQLGISEIESSDSLAMALADYAAASTRWRRGWYGAALDSMVTVAARHARTEVAPKALLAAGRIFLEWADADSMDLYGPLPLTVPDTVLEKAGLLSSGRPDAGATDFEDPSPSIESSQPPESGGDAPRRRLEPEPGQNEPNASAEPAGDDPAPEASAQHAGGVPLPEASAAERIFSDTSAAESAATDTSAAEMAATDTSAADPADPSAAEPSNPTDPVLADTSATGDAPADTTNRALADSNGADMTGSALPDTSAMVLALAGAIDAELPGDTTAIPDNAVFLSTLYASVREHYPSTPYADQASDLLDALEQRRRQLEMLVVPPDVMLAATDRLGAVGWLAAGALFTASTDSVAVDTTWADTAAVDPLRTREDTLAQSSDVTSDDELADAGVRAAEVDTTDRPAEVDTTDRPAEVDTTDRPADVAADTAGAPDGSDASPDATPASEAQSDADAFPSGDEAIRGEGGIRAELGGFTIGLGMNVEREPMEVLVQKYADRGFRADVVETTVGGTTLYRAAVGHFRTMEAAAAALNELREEIEEPVQVAPLATR